MIKKRKYNNSNSFIDSTNSKDSNKKIKEIKSDNKNFENNENIANNLQLSNNNNQNEEKKLSNEQLNKISDYKDFIEKENRNFCQIYYSFLQYDQLIIFTFITNTDNNFKPIKISLFIFAIVLYLTSNTLFYNDDSISNNYKNNGHYDIIYNLPKTLFSSVCCAIINIILKFLSLSQKKLEKLKKKSENAKKSKENNYNNNDNKKRKNIDFSIAKIILKTIRKIILFYIFLFIIMILFWYYESVFCSVYVNSQKNLFINTGMNFFYSMFIPFGLSLLKAIFRYMALKCQSKCLFCFSKIIMIL